MTQSSEPRQVVVSATPIELCQFLKFGGLAATGGEAKAVISAGKVLLNGSRRQRIAQGAGVKIVEVNQLLKQFQQMQKMMKMMKGGGAKKMMRQMEAMKGKGGGFPGM